MSDCDKTGCGKRLNIRHTLPCFLLAFAISSCVRQSTLAQLLFAQSRAQQRITRLLVTVDLSHSKARRCLVGDCIIVGRHRVFVLV